MPLTLSSLESGPSSLHTLTLEAPLGTSKAMRSPPTTGVIVTTSTSGTIVTGPRRAGSSDSLPLRQE